MTQFHSWYLFRHCCQDISLQNSNFLMAVSYKYFFPSIGGNFTVQTIADHFGHKLNFVPWTHPIPLWITRVNDLTQTVQKKLDRLASPSTRIPSKDFILQYKINGKRTHFTWSICLWKLRKIMTVSFHKKNVKNYFKQWVKWRLKTVAHNYATSLISNWQHMDDKCRSVKTFPDW